MNKFLIVFIVVLLFGCKSDRKNSLSGLNFEKTRLVLDTLIFNENMDGELLEEKYASSLAELQFYKQFVSENKILNKQILKEEYETTEIIYLGKLMDLNGFVA